MAVLVVEAAAAVTDSEAVDAAVESSACFLLLKSSLFFPFPDGATDDGIANSCLIAWKKKKRYWSIHVGYDLLIMQKKP